MTEKRFPVGELITVVGAAVAVGGVTLTWFALHIVAGQGAATFSLWGWEYVLGWVACIAAVAGGLVGLTGLVAGARMGRVGGLVALGCGVVALAAVGIQLAAAPNVEAMNKRIGLAFGKAELDGYNQKMTGWSDIRPSVETGAGLWMALGGGALVFVGGALTAALGGKRQAVAAGVLPYGAAGPLGQPDPYGQPLYQPPVGGYPGAGQPLPPPGAGVVMTGAPPFAPAAAGVPMGQAAAPVPQPQSVSAPAAQAANMPVTPAAAAPAPQTAGTPARFCAKCGGSFADDTSRFCVKCGAPRPGVG